MLHLCASCRRHVKESPCPFCGGNQRVESRGASTQAGLSRAQMIAGAALISAAAACGSSSPPTAAPVYGAPATPEGESPIPTDRTDAGTSATPPIGAAPATPPPNSVMPLYGMPPG